MNSTGKIVQLVNPTNNQDAATKSYVDTKFITVPTPTNTQDAANKGYVDTKTTDMATTSSVSTAITTALGSSGTQSNWPTVQNDSVTDSSYPVIFIKNSDAPQSNGSSNRALLRCDVGGLVYYPNADLLSATRLTANYVGIGTSSPSAPLHVTSWSNLSPGGTGFYWNLNTNSGVDPTPSREISIITERSILIRGTHIWITSDQRIKKNIVNLNTDKMVNVFRNLRPISFDFIDPMKNYNKKHLGFIAQEVNEVLPESISLNTDVIPNNMMKADITKPIEMDETPCFTLKPVDTDITLQYLLLTTDSPLNFDTANPYSSTDTYKFKVYCGEKWTKEQDIYIRSDYNVTDDKYTYVIGMKKDAYDVVMTEPTLFVYGQYVYDLHILDHDTIYTVATAALQEVDRQQQADKARIAELEATVAQQQSLINDILERLKALEKA